MEAIREGKTAFLTVAGGQGSRLGFDGPKGMYPVTPIRRATLFQVFAEKLRGFAEQEKAKIPWYIMTSPLNDAETRRYFEEQRFFGLPESDVVFFTQGTLPTLDQTGRLLLDENGGLFQNPDGHGGLVTALRRHKLLDEMKSRSVEYLFYFQVDNPLVNVPDPEYLGHHILAGARVAAKVIPKRSPEEKVGVISILDGRPCIVEYSDLSPENMHARNEDGTLKFLQGSIAIHIFNVSFLASDRLELPLHVARKEVRVMDPATGQITETPGIKFERFIFDVVPQAGDVLFYEISREDEFSPVKNAEGLDSPETCERDQIAKAARMLAQSQVEVPRDGEGNPSVKLEISPLYAWNSAALARRLEGADIRIDEDTLLLD
jgi:UDP-N-acetylglucosamine/UDP-N-acetylgalactosamine diphosphorylase